MIKSKRNTENQKFFSVLKTISNSNINGMAKKNSQKQNTFITN